MKDSGIEWIGYIPQDWRTLKLKYIKDKYYAHFKSISDESFPSQRMMIEDFKDDINELIILMAPK